MHALCRARSFIVVALGIEHLATLYRTAAQRVVTRLLLAILAVSGLGCLTFYEIGWVGIPQRIQLVVIAAGTFGAAVRALHMHHPVSRFLDARK